MIQEGSMDHQPLVSARDLEKMAELGNIGRKFGLFLRRDVLGYFSQTGRQCSHDFLDFPISFKNCIFVPR